MHLSSWTQLFCNLFIKCKYVNFHKFWWKSKEIECLNWVIPACFFIYWYNRDTLYLAHLFYSYLRTRNGIVKLSMMVYYTVKDKEWVTHCIFRIQFINLTAAGHLHCWNHAVSKIFLIRMSKNIWESITGAWISYDKISLCSNDDSIRLMGQY